jgi:signal transduction histidine kinase
MMGGWILILAINYLMNMGLLAVIGYIVLAGLLVVVRIVRDWTIIKREGWIILTSILLVVASMLSNILLESNVWFNSNIMAQFLNVSFIYLSIPIGMLIHITLSYTRLTRERNQKLEKEVAEATEHLKATMAQLVQQEKLASLGQLTAGIAHEIKNPLNFVNNFASVSRELVDEALKDVVSFRLSVFGEDSPLKTENRQQITTIEETLSDVERNLAKIHEHGSRADKIVKSMLLHSRGGSGKMEPTDINALVQEYANLAFHGMRAGKNPISVDIRYELDPKAGSIPLVAEDFSRVILNLCNNAFDALRDGAMRDVKGATSDSNSSTDNRQLTTENKLILRTKRTSSAIVIEVEDNGPGIPDENKSRILEPFFTTKKGTDGTGLGLSISNDILQAHGGSMSIDSVPGKTTFILTLPC